MALRCLIVDDNRDFLAAAQEVLRRDRINVVGVASTSAEALEQAAELRPDVALVDVYLGDEDGFDLARRLAEGLDGVHTAVILISTYADRDLGEMISASPAVAFLSKAELSGRAIHAVLRAADQL